jgi:hypothetical protein
MLLSMDMHVNDAGFNDGMQMDMMDMGFQPFSQEGQAARQIPDSHQQPQQQTTAYPSSNMSAYFPPRESVSAAPQSQSQSHEPTRSVGGGNGLEGRQHSMPRKNIGLFGQGIPMSDEENMYDRYDVGPTGTSGSNAHMPSTSFCGFRSSIRSFRQHLPTLQAYQSILRLSTTLSHSLRHKQHSAWTPISSSILSPVSLHRRLRHLLARGSTFLAASQSPGRQAEPSWIPRWCWRWVPCRQSGKTSGIAAESMHQCPGPRHG